MKFLQRLLNYVSPQDPLYIGRLRELLGFMPSNISIYRLAFKHSSKSLETHTSNERLEYLGDSVLGAIVAEFLFLKYPLRDEGFLTEMRSKIVNRKRLGEIGHKLHLQYLMEYEESYVKINSTILGNAFEALMGAIYLDAGYTAARRFVLEKIISQHIDLEELQSGDINFKSRLFEWAQKYDHELKFEVIEEKMINKVRTFVIGAYVDDKLIAKAEGRSKKDAQKEASRKIYERYRLDKEDTD